MKIKIAIAVMALAVVGVIASCNKESKSPITQPVGSSTAPDLSHVAKGKGGIGISVTFPAGHPASQCHGQGLCYIGGPLGTWRVHVPCQASGSDCEWEIGVSMTPAVIDYDEPVTYDLAGKIEAYTGEVFLMPARSIYSTELELYVNIPRQIAYPTENECEYLFKDVRFTTEPAYDNND